MVVSKREGRRATPSACLGASIAFDGITRGTLGTLVATATRRIVALLRHNRITVDVITHRGLRTFVRTRADDHILLLGLLHRGLLSKVREGDPLASPSSYIVDTRGVILFGESG
jgi:hypothetical protein